MARYRGGDGHYADVECTYAELKRYLVLNTLRLAVGSVAFAPQPLMQSSRQPTNFLSVVGHEDCEACQSQRGARSLSAFCGERDGDYADRVFAFANSVLTDLLKQQSRQRPQRLAALPSSPSCRFLGRQSLDVEPRQ
jgi:hypothetical protein